MRLDALLHPAPPPRRRERLAAAGLATGLMATAGTGALAMAEAAQSPAPTRMATSSPVGSTVPPPSGADVASRAQHSPQTQAAAASRPGSTLPVITRPEWVQRPDGADIAGAYPLQARLDGTSGRATITCVPDAARVLTQCKILSEAPIGAGFGEAALRVAPKFRVRPGSAKTDGSAEVVVPILWRLGDESPPAPGALERPPAMPSIPPPLSPPDAAGAGAVTIKARQMTHRPGPPPQNIYSGDVLVNGKVGGADAPPVFIDGVRAPAGFDLGSLTGRIDEMVLAHTSVTINSPERQKLTSVNIRLKK